MFRGRIFAILVIMLFFFSLVLMVRAQTETSVWRDDLNYSTFAQFQSAGWSSTRPAGLNFTGTGVVLDGTQADTSFSYSGFPSSIYNWRVEDRSRWIAGSHSGNGVGVSTDKHSYYFMADGWYGNFAFYRDSAGKILTFGSYQEKLDEWMNTSMVKQGNKIDLYFNDQLEYSYTEADTTPSQLTGCSINNPWQGAAEYNYIEAWSLSPSATPTPATSAGDAWTIFGHDLANTRYSPYTGPKTNQTLWTSTLDSGVRPTAVTVLGDTIYAGTNSGTVYALNANTGKTLWTFATGSKIWSSTTIFNGVVYVGSVDGGYFALDATKGTRIWNFSTRGGIWTSPVVVGNIVYVGEADPGDNFYALDAATGTILWNYTTDGQIRDTPAVVNGVVYVGTQNSQGGTLYAFDAATGRVIWTSPTHDGDTYVNSSPAVVNGVVYVGSTDHHLYAFKASDGTQLWAFQAGNKVSSSPAVFNGVVYFGSEDNNFYAVKASDGTKVWSQPADGAIYSSPAVADGVVYVGSYGGSVYAFDAGTGANVWTYNVGQGVFSSPAVAGGALFIASMNGNVYAFGASYTPSSVPPASMPSIVTTSPSNAPSGAAPPSSSGQTGTFTFKGWIDGYDYLYVRGGGASVWYYHIRSDPPGYAYNNVGAQYNLQHHDSRPTYIDDNPWTPTWANISSSATTWIDVQSLSDVYANTGPHPLGAWNITSITNVVARDNLTIVEYPSASNDYTAKFVLDDWTFLPNGTNPTGADWYSFTMNWITNGPLSQSASDVTKTAWVPPPANGAVAGVVAAGGVSIVALLAAAASSAPAAASTGFFDRLVAEVRKLLPDTVKKWMEDFISSKRKLKIDEKTGSPYLPTKPETLVYAIAVVLLTLSFSYVKVSNLSELLIVLPTFFATSILVALIRTYVLTVYARRQGVWTEYKLWYFGVAMFLLSTLAFKAPFSSPTRTVHHSRNFTEKLGGFLSVAGLLITLAFGGFFFVLLKAGLVLIGGTGLAMCIISAFFDTFPIEPMGGKDIYKYNKALWAGLFVVSLALYVAWLANVL